jgi:hypothetical protein
MSRIAPSLADGRSFTSYVSASQYNETMKAKLGLENENQYRVYMQKNAKDVLRESRKLTVISRKEDSAWNAQ